MSDNIITQATAPAVAVTGAAIMVEMALDAANILYASIRRGPERIDRGTIVARMKDLVEDLERAAGSMQDLRRRAAVHGSPAGQLLPCPGARA